MSSCCFYPNKIGALRFLESFNYVMHCWRWNIQISSYLLWGTLFLNISIIFSRICWQTGDPRPIFAPKGLDLSWMLLLYQIIITITCWHQLFQITSLFNQFTSLLALNCSCPTFFGMCCRSEWQERMYIYKWHEVDQTKHEIFCVHIVCNEIQVKVNLEITTFFFICVFHTVPTFSDLGLYFIWSGCRSLKCFISLMHFLLLMSARLLFMKRAHLRSFQITQQEPGWPGTRYHRDVFIF